MNSVKSPTELLARLNLSEQDFCLSDKAIDTFPLLVPLAFISRIKPGDPKDPLLLQVINSKQEELIVPDYSADPLHESDANPVPGLVRKYQNRALLIVTGKCAINCRYCFRREFPYEQNNPSRNDWTRALDYLAQHKEIEEVILSGGDPLAASDRHLKWLIEAVSNIATIKRLRVHTRLPIVIPDRITGELTGILDQCPLITTVVVHANHTNEMDESVISGLNKLKSKVDFLLNQSVLLKGVNDSLDAQVKLQNACVAAGVQPYYLHFLDKVNGTSHFEVSKKSALKLYAQMQASLSGFMLPKLVVELPRSQSKQILQ